MLLQDRAPYLLLAPVLKYVVSSASQLAGPVLLQSLLSALSASPSRCQSHVRQQLTNSCCGCLRVAFTPVGEVFMKYLN